MTKQQGLSRNLGPFGSDAPLVAVSDIISAGLLRILQEAYQLSWDGIHGYSHWARVRQNGLRLAGMTGAKPKVVELFAFLHDSQRRNDSIDPDDGKRAADFIDSLKDAFVRLPDEELQLLQYACAGHTDGLTEGDVTVQTCWDADRLDLGRVGIRPDVQRLCTSVARQPKIIEWACARNWAVRTCRSVRLTASRPAVTHSEGIRQSPGLCAGERDAPGYAYCMNPKVKT